MVSENKTYWENRYARQETGWDIGYASPPLTHYFEQVQDRSCSILIPGCGNAYEAIWLQEHGFKNIHVCDIARAPLKKLQGKKNITCILDDFFNIKGQYDYIVEQTFFCALDPSLRPAYVAKMASLMHAGSRLVGVLFATQFSKLGPPHGGTKEEYEILFGKTFDFHCMERCNNSIAPRLNNEIFINFRKKIE